MKLSFLLFSVALVSCSTTKVTELKQGSKSLLKECIETDQAVAQLNVDISQRDLLILKTMTDRASVSAKSSKKGEIHADAFWDAMLISTKSDLESLMTTRMDSVRNASVLSEKIVSECSSVSFTKETIKQVCSNPNLSTTRWCLTKFF